MRSFTSHAIYSNVDRNFLQNISQAQYQAASTVRLHSAACPPPPIEDTGGSKLKGKGEIYDLWTSGRVGSPQNWQCFTGPTITGGSVPSGCDPRLATSLTDYTFIELGTLQPLPRKLPFVFPALSSRGLHGKVL